MTEVAINYAQQVEDIRKRMDILLNLRGFKIKKYNETMVFTRLDMSHALYIDLSEKPTAFKIRYHNSITYVCVPYDSQEIPLIVQEKVTLIRDAFNKELVDMAMFPEKHSKKKGPKIISTFPGNGGPDQTPEQSNPVTGPRSKKSPPPPHTPPSPLQVPAASGSRDAGNKRPDTQDPGAQGSELPEAPSLQPWASEVPELEERIRKLEEDLERLNIQEAQRLRAEAEEEAIREEKIIEAISLKGKASRVLEVEKLKNDIFEREKARRAEELESGLSLLAGSLGIQSEDLKKLFINFGASAMASTGEQAGPGQEARSLKSNEPRVSDSNEQVIRNISQDGVVLTKNSKGYQWEITARGDNLNEIIDKVIVADERLKTKFFGKSMSSEDTESGN